MTVTDISKNFVETGINNNYVQSFCETTSTTIHKIFETNSSFHMK